MYKFKLTLWQPFSKNNLSKATEENRETSMYKSLEEDHKRSSCGYFCTYFLFFHWVDIVLPSRLEEDPLGKLSAPMSFILDTYLYH